MGACECGCGAEAKKGNRFLNGHNAGPRTRGTSWSEETRRKQSEAKLGKRTGPDSHAWKGGRYVAEDGYVWVWVPRDHPLGNPNDRSKVSGEPTSFNAPEHRVVAYDILGDELLDEWPDFQVHHRDGRRDRNEPENLIVLIDASSHSTLEWAMKRGLTEEEALAELGEDSYKFLVEDLDPAFKTAAELVLV